MWSGSTQGSLRWPRMPTSEVPTIRAEAVIAVLPVSRRVRRSLLPRPDRSLSSKKRRSGPTNGITGDPGSRDVPRSPMRRQSRGWPRGLGE